MRNRNRAAGFSLVELLLAILVLLFGVAAVAKLIPTAIQSNFFSRYDSTALILSERLLDQMAAQEMTAGDPLGANQPYFFNTTLPNGAPITCFLGVSPPVLTAPPGNPPPGPVQSGANTIIAPAGEMIINWTAAGQPNYSGFFQGVEGYQYELRWAVITYYGNINGSIRPVGKRFLVSTRGGPRQPARGFLPPTTLTTSVGWRE